jgi:hypothetical protein
VISGTQSVGVVCPVSGFEEWRTITDYEVAYEISDIGRIYNIRFGRILKLSLDSAGRPRVALCFHGKATHFLVAHLVAAAFLPPKGPTDQVLRHLNDDPTDNRTCNLAWGTYSDNTQDIIRNGGFPDRQGIANSYAKLTEDDVREIRLLYATGKCLQPELARRFAVSKMTISDVVRRKTWKHLT